MPAATVRATWTRAVAVLAVATGLLLLAVPAGAAIPTTPWVARTVDAHDWYATGYGNGRFVVLSYDGHLTTSTDGVTWTAATSDAATANGMWNAVAYAAGRWVALAWGGANRGMWSDDGLTWHSTSGVPDGTWAGVAYGHGRWIAIQNGGAAGESMITSVDGKTWSPVAGSPAAGSGAWDDIAFGNGRFVAVGEGRGGGLNAATSGDGLTWTEQTTGGPGLLRIATDGSTFVAASSGAFLTSPDGATWTSRTAPNAHRWDGVAYGDGLFVGNGNDVPTSNPLAASDDAGTTWTGATSPIDGQEWYTTTYGAGLFVAVSIGGHLISWSIPPTLSTVSPASAPTAGGTSVTLTGTALDGVSVTFGGVAATSVTQVSPTAVIAVAPAHAAGAVDVVVTNLGGTSTRAGAFTYAAATTASAPAPSPTSTPTSLRGRTSCSATQRTCTTTGTAPRGTTRVTQTATRASRSASALKPTRGTCRLGKAGPSGTRRYSCTIRLRRGTWSVATTAFAGKDVVARSTARRTIR